MSRVGPTTPREIVASREVPSAANRFDTWASSAGANCSSVFTSSPWSRPEMAPRSASTAPWVASPDNSAVARESSFPLKSFCRSVSSETP